MSNKLVAFFSPSGVTATTAFAVAKIAGADVYEIEPEVVYTADDMNWQNLRSRSSCEMGDPNCRPAIKTPLQNIDGYDIIFIGFPIWWYTAPRIIETFLESYDFTGKTIIPFATSGGSGMGKTEARMQSVCKGTADWKEGAVINRKTAKEIETWVASLQLDY